MHAVGPRTRQGQGTKNRLYTMNDTTEHGIATIDRVTTLMT